MDAAASFPWGVNLAYVLSGVLFIFALRGLSRRDPGRSGNRFGMAGMAVAVGTTLYIHNAASLPEIIVAVVIGAAIGLVTAQRVAISALPQLVAAFHSLVGLAAVAVGVAVYDDPGAFGLLDAGLGEIMTHSRVELGLGVAVGAMTFSGSVIAFLRLNGAMSGKPVLLPARHLLNLGMFVAILGLIACFSATPAPSHVPWLLWTVIGLSFLIGFLLIIPIGGADMPVVVSMLNSCSGWVAAAIGFTFQNMAMVVAGAVVGSSGAVLTYMLCKAMNRSLLSVMAGGVGADAAAEPVESLSFSPEER